MKYATLRGLWRTAQQAESAENLCTRTCRRGRIEERGRSGDYLQCDTADTVTATARTSERRRGTRAESANTKTLTGALLFMESRLQRQTDARKYHLLPSLPSDALRPSLAKPRISILQDASWLPSSWRLGAIGNLSHRGLRGCRLSLLPNWKRAACPPPLSLALRRRTDWRREGERARERERDRERDSPMSTDVSLSPLRAGPLSALLLLPPPPPPPPSSTSPLGPQTASPAPGDHSSTWCALPFITRCHCSPSPQKLGCPVPLTL